MTMLCFIFISNGGSEGVRGEEDSTVEALMIYLLFLLLEAMSPKQVSEYVQEVFLIWSKKRNTCLSVAAITY